MVYNIGVANFVRTCEGHLYGVHHSGIQWGCWLIIIEIFQAWHYHSWIAGLAQNNLKNRCWIHFGTNIHVFIIITMTFVCLTLLCDSKNMKIKYRTTFNIDFAIWSCHTKYNQIHTRGIILISSKFTYPTWTVNNTLSVHVCWFISQISQIVQCALWYLTTFFLGIDEH